MISNLYGIHKNLHAKFVLNKHQHGTQLNKNVYNVLDNYLYITIQHQNVVIFIADKLKNGIEFFINVQI
jgi:hypothetical protein